ncbi:MAG: flagellar assembly protein FliH [Gammaproteobacteria bacterium]|jgi:flagellar assembly protein FliH|nr:flagellar assembly protein FliH [Gammaproteobacteria bacterium]MBT3722617.1 flagellar assembly protein FliH [Gammaproteobacteria bacterium]MBT4075598.1 flagellar assembly protein FliH [Gammaproteobacteria bacterium]MBT4193063.1 flagellar assembly protein FliH [Gammaproteobacteria bacterium]MBT4451472.1 flagellar assembly protein FliH [Gammaproteobacteria bacterium]
MPNGKNKIIHDQDVDAEKWSPPSMGSKPSQIFRSDKNQAQKDAEAELEVDAPPIPTAKEIESWHEEAREEGYQQGLKQAEKEIAEQKQQLLNVINFFEQPLQYLNEEVEQQLNLLAVTLAQQLVRREIRAEPGEIVAVIRESVKMLSVNSRKIRISLHPEDAEIVKKALQLDELDDEQSWKLIEDPMITRGGCEIKSGQSIINATLENRLQALAASILGGERIEDQSEIVDESAPD